MKAAGEGKKFKASYDGAAKEIKEYEEDEEVSADKILLKDVDLTIDMKSRVALLGRNGCGKSTLIKIFVMLDTTSPSSLKILLDGKINNDDVPPVAQPVDKGLQTSPSFASSFFGGGERALRSISSHDATINDRRKEGESASTAAAEQNMEDGGA